MLVAGGTVLGGASIAGCIGGDDGPETTATDTTAESTGTDDGSYTVTMSPVGEVTFDGVPETVMGFYPWYADMTVAVGHGDSLASLYAPEMFGGGMRNYYHHLDGVSLDWAALRDPNPGDGTNKEIFYDVGADVHFIDPALLSTQDGWNRQDIADVERDLGPFFGNYYSTRRIDPPAAYRDDYEYYTVWELAAKVAAVFQEEDRFREIAAMHEEMMAAVEPALPPTEDRPTVARVWMTDGSFDTFHVDQRGIWRADVWPLGPRDAFGGEQWDNGIGTIDYEGLLEADPDVILVMSGTTSFQNVTEVRETLADHPVGGQLSAVQNERVYASGAAWHQGPILTLFGLEMTAKQLYPEQFGEWPGYVDGEPLPEVPAGEQLFDRQRLANAVTGEVDG